MIWRVVGYLLIAIVVILMSVAVAFFVEPQMAVTRMPRRFNASM